MNSLTNTRKFPTILDMVVMLLLFFVAQMLSGVLVQSAGITAPTTSAIDAVDIETYMTIELK